MENTKFKNNNFKFSKIKKIMSSSYVSLDELAEALYERIDKTDILNYNEDIEYEYIYVIHSKLESLFENSITRQEMKQQYKFNNEYILDDVLLFLSEINCDFNQNEFR